MMTFRDHRLRDATPAAVVNFVSSIATPSTRIIFRRSWLSGRSCSTSSASTRFERAMAESPACSRCWRSISRATSWAGVSAWNVSSKRREKTTTLRQSSQRWHEGKHDLLPWLNHFLSIIRRAYGEFERRAGEITSPRGAKAGLVLAAIREQSGEFRLADIERACPGVGREWIRSLLTDLKAAGEATCRGKGPAARWLHLGSKGTDL